MKSSVLAIITGLIIIVASFITVSSSALIADDAWALVDELTDVGTFPAYSGQKESVYIKDGKEYKQHLTIYYHSPGAFKFVYHDPDSQKGNSFGALKGKMVIYFPTQRMRMKMPLSKSEFSALDIIGLKIKPELLKKNFTATIETDETVLGRNCTVLKFASVGNAKFERRLWVDKEKMIILKKISSINARPYHMSQYTEVSFEKPGKDDIEIKVPIGVIPIPQRKTTYYTPEEATKKTIKTPYSRPGFIPQEYELESIAVRKGIIGGGVILFYYDGLSKMEIVFDEKGGMMSGMAQKAMKGKLERVIDDMHIYSPATYREKNINEQGVSITAELAPEIIQKTLDSISLD